MNDEQTQEYIQLIEDIIFVYNEKHPEAELYFSNYKGVEFFDLGLDYYAVRWRHTNKLAIPPTQYVYRLYTQLTDFIESGYVSRLNRAYKDFNWMD